MATRFFRQPQRALSRVFRNSTRPQPVVTTTYRSASVQAAVQPTPMPATFAPSTEMFCFQCEQTENGTGCTAVGVCGKTPEVAALQDLLVQYIKGISMYAHRARVVSNGQAVDRDVDEFVLRALFSTLTNVNFDPARFDEYLDEAVNMRDRAKQLYEAACADANVLVETLYGPAVDPLPEGHVERVNAGLATGVAARKSVTQEDIFSLQEMTLYAIKGAAAYAEHALILGELDPTVSADLHQVLDSLTQERSLEDCLATVLKVGEINLRVLQLLDSASSSKYGNPVPTEVSHVPVPGKCILMSGHDLRDVELILKMTEGTGINVYTHGELLPAHGFPELHKYKHFVGHFGGAWQNQKFDFREFPGPIVMTTNCLIEPRKSYRHRLFTRSVTGWPGVQHITDDRDLQKVVDCALQEEGFTEDSARALTPAMKTSTTGFHHTAVLGLAEQIVGAVKSGDISHFFVIGGCDGSEGERSYFSDLAQSTPDNSVILTLGCGKFRVLNQPVAQQTIGNTGIPRVLDVGQCNDSYSAAVIALKLAEAFETDINSLPLSFGVSWFEQKAVAVLTTLLHLGVTNIRLGPHLPGFVTPNVLNVLVEKFKLHPTNPNTVQEDMKNMLKNQ